MATRLGHTSVSMSTPTAGLNCCTKRRTTAGVSQGGQTCGSPGGRSRGPSVRPVAVPWVSSRRRPGRRSRSAVSKMAAARVSPSGVHGGEQGEQDKGVDAVATASSPLSCSPCSPPCTPLGETRAAAILLTALRERLPGLRLLLTHGTATGRTDGPRLRPPGDPQVWPPWDTPAVVRRFVQQFRPAVGVLMETEVWPNLVAICREEGVPLALANARLSDKSLGQALRVAPLARPTYTALAAVWAQTEDDAR